MVLEKREAQYKLKVKELKQTIAEKNQNIDKLTTKIQNLQTNEQIKADVLSNALS